jgi:hypothetical protein
MVLHVAKIRRDATAPLVNDKTNSLEERIEAILKKTEKIAQSIEARRSSISECDNDSSDDEAEEFSIMDDETNASSSFKRNLSRFLSLPRSLSHREMEEVDQD